MRRAAALAAVASLAGATLVAALPPPAGPADAPVRDPGPDGRLVLAVLGPERAMVADPRSGETTARELPGGTLCHGPLVAAGGRVAYIGSRHGRFTALSAPLGRPGRARSLGHTDVLMASSTPGLLWLGRTSPLAGHRSRLSLREVDAGGRVVARARHVLPGRGTLGGSPDDGLLIARDWRMVLHRLHLIGAAGPRFAWCERGCRRVRAWTERGEHTLDPPAGLRPEPAARPAFSPDGERLALPVTTPAGARVAVVDLEAGRWRIVPGARIDGYMAAAWSPSGRWLYFTGRGNRLLASRAGVVRPVRLPVRTGGAVMSIAVS